MGVYGFRLLCIIMNTKYHYDKEIFEVLVKQSNCIRHLLELMGLTLAGGNYKTVNEKVRLWNIDITHWGSSKQRMGWLRGKRHDWGKKYPLDKILVENSTYRTTSRIKQKLLDEGIFIRKCYKCKNTDWMGLNIPLELEHINGNNTDNRIENLTLLCPNCHAQTPTHAGKNKRKVGATGGT